MLKFKVILVAVLLAFTTMFASGVPAANAGYPSGQITRAGYVSNPGYGPNVMYMNCIKTNGVGAQIGLTVYQSSVDYNCKYVYSVYIPAGWQIDCNGSPKWGATAYNRWVDWPGTNWISCLWH